MKKVTFAGIELEVECQIEGRIIHYGNNHPDNEFPEVEIIGVSVKGGDISDVFDFKTHEGELEKLIAEIYGS